MKALKKSLITFFALLFCVSLCLFAVACDSSDEVKQASEYEYLTFTPIAETENASVKFNWSLVRDETTGTFDEDTFYNLPKNWVLPSKVIIEGKEYTVTEIEYSGFSEMPFESIVLPQYLTAIGDYAFAGSTYMNKIIIPAGVNHIGVDAFYYCYKLVEVWNLSPLNIVAGSDENGMVGKYAKAVYTDLNTSSQVFVSNNFRYIPIENGKLCLLGTTNQNLTSVSGYDSRVTEIAPYAFSRCQNVESVSLDGVVKVGTFAFYDLDKLLNVTIPATLTTVEDGAFLSCDHLLEVRNLSSMQITAGDGDVCGDVARFAKAVYTDDTPFAAQVIENLIYWEEGDDIILIGTMTDKNSLTTLDNIDGRTTVIADHAFSSYENLTSLTIPASVKKIEESAFGRCEKLETLTFLGTTDIEGWAFEHCSSLKIISLNGGVLGYGAFQMCSGIEEIYLSGEITVTADRLFAECPNVKIFYYNVTGDLTGTSNRKLGFNNVDLEEYYIGKDVTVLPWGAQPHAFRSIKNIYIEEGFSASVLSGLMFSNCGNFDVVIDSSSVADSMTSDIVLGGLLLYCNDVYVKTGLTVEHSAYLLNADNFTKTELSDIEGYDKYERVVAE